MSVDPFVDTNIWVYAHTEEPRDLRGPLAKAMVEDRTRFVIGTQVLSEYYAAMLKNGAVPVPFGGIPDVAAGCALVAPASPCLP